MDRKPSSSFPASSSFTQQPAPTELSPADSNSDLQVAGVCERMHRKLITSVFSIAHNIFEMACGLASSKRKPLAAEAIAASRVVFQKASLANDQAIFASCGTFNSLLDVSIPSLMQAATDQQAMSRRSKSHITLAMSTTVEPLFYSAVPPLLDRVAHFLLWLSVANTHHVMEMC